VSRSPEGSSNAGWRRLYDSFAWRWIVGPIAYAVVVSALMVVVVGQRPAAAIAFAATMALVLVIQALRQRGG
jgi:hypothetical protein